MLNIELIIEERAVNAGNFMVDRLVPFREKRAVDPFVFIDHRGLDKIGERDNLDVLLHWHIGLSTLTFLFEGSIMHRDSIGAEIEIKPGAVNWIIAGCGVVHSERTPEYLRDSIKMLHKLQIWVALPKDLEEMSPEFHHVEANDIPEWEQDGVKLKLIAGKAFRRKLPVSVHNILYFIEIKSHQKQIINIGDDLFGESALSILNGSKYSEGNTYKPKQILIAQDARLCEFEIGANTTIDIFGGEPYPEERFINWNFVSSSKERLQQTKEDWIAQKFLIVLGETEFVPYHGT